MTTGAGGAAVLGKIGTGGLGSICWCGVDPYFEVAAEGGGAPVVLAGEDEAGIGGCLSGTPLGCFDGDGGIVDAFGVEVVIEGTPPVNEGVVADGGVVVVVVGVVDLGGNVFGLGGPGG